jgi:glucose/arabinose dehydrogenase
MDRDAIAAKFGRALMAWLQRIVDVARIVTKTLMNHPGVRRPTTARHIASLAGIAIAVSSQACAPAAPDIPGVSVEVVATGLVTPWSIALASDGRIFVSERPGRIRVVMRDSLRDTPWATLDAAERANLEMGLMGVALHPNFPREPYLYACYTVRTPGVALINRVVRLTDVGGRGTDAKTLIDSIPAGMYHDGCRLAIGPDGKLYVTTGDGYEKTHAQDSSSLAGKVLRVELDGSIPADNPIAGSRVWTMGHRNPQGIAWDPRTGLGILTEHGDGTIDEINALERGANYGWPIAQGRAGNTKFVEPSLVFHVAPTGAAFLPALDGGDTSRMLITALSGRLIELAVAGRSVSVRNDSVLFGYGRLRDVAVTRDGSIYVVTSNRDGRGEPRRGDDKLLRLRLRNRMSGGDTLGRH